MQLGDELLSQLRVTRLFQQKYPDHGRGFAVQLGVQPGVHLRLHIAGRDLVVNRGTGR
jgi:hypothetical protein